uniref:G_PROTEIN_RECEP_F1_2 domain-containing protein n=1 Tax=Syphacia muris TaxID=451379 RepID=A0A0N5AD98_9BILA
MLDDASSDVSGEETPVPFEWCFDILLYCQIRHSSLFSRRLASHLRLLCLWDMLLLICCFITNGVSSVYYKITPTYGFSAYIVYFFQPLASFCVTCAIWQVSVITTERYMAISHPFIHQSIKDRFKLKLICFTTVTCSFLLNIVTIPVERELRNCLKVEVKNNKLVPSASIQLVQKEIMSNRYYAIFVYLVPDFLFRAPVPTILIAVLTAQTLLIYKKRRLVSTRARGQRFKSTPFMLTVLNLKFILGNTLYMFNTVLVEVMGYGRLYSSQTENNKMEHYIGTLYLSDLSNMLLALHSATNWLIFYNWKTKSTARSLSGAFKSRFDVTLIDPKKAEQLLHRFETQKDRIGKEVMYRLCQESSTLTDKLNDEVICEKSCVCDDESAAAAHGKVIYDFIEEILKTLLNDAASIDKIREKCRNVGRIHYEAQIRFTTEQWKEARDLMIWCATGPSNKWTNTECYDNRFLEAYAKKVFNFIFAELKNGAFLAAVDEKQKVK